MNVSKLTTEERIKRLSPPKGKVHVVIDTDAYNEVDDQFALAYAIKSIDKIELEAIYAAPFHNHRSKSPKDGMEQSYDEILNILKMLDVTDKPVYKGSIDYLKNINMPQQSDAANDLVQRAMAREDEPLYVVAIGAITNIASAILIEPKIVDKIVLIWLGGNALFWHDTNEFNLKQDVQAARLIFDCGVPLVHVPCMGVTTHLVTTIPELEYYLMGKSVIGTYLTKIVKSYTPEPFGWSKVIWDLAAVAWLVNPEWMKSDLVHSPIVTDQMTWSFDMRRHFIRSVSYMNRDKIFKDVFEKLID